MLNNQPLVIDAKELESVAKALPYIPTLSSWQPNAIDPFMLSYQQLPSHEIPNYCTEHHLISLFHNPVQIAARLDSVKLNTLFCPGNSGLIPSGFEHWAAWEDPLDLSVIFLHPQFVSDIAQGIVKGDRIELIPKHETQDPIIYNLGAAIKADVEEGCSMGRLYSESIATALVIRLLKNHSVQQPQPKNNTGGLSQPQLQQVIDYVYEHLDQDIKLTELAQLVNESQYHLCHLFKQSTGIAPHQYLIQQRIERAKWLLVNREFAISEVAVRCGFANQSHLHRHFKKIVGVTPKALRAESKCDRKNVQI